MMAALNDAGIRNLAFALLVSRMEDMLYGAAGPREAAEEDIRHDPFVRGLLEVAGCDLEALIGNAEELRGLSRIHLRRKLREILTNSSFLG